VRMILKSPSFSSGEMIPLRHTCDGENISPALEWSDFPPGIKSFALVCDDPDAPGKEWVHWVYFNISSDKRNISENIPPAEHPASGGIQGRNDFGKIGYGGACPPSGIHRYFFRIFAIDTVLALPPGASKAQVTKAIHGHVLAEAELMGKYTRKKLHP
jgi:Raf kinase inhibitor-like YbhB/YbcL family protein